MKVFWSWFAKILLVVAIIEAWFLYDMYTKNQQLISENIELEKQLIETQDSLSSAQAKIEELEKTSIEGMLKETNKAVISGWETLLDAVESELNKAKKSIDSTIDDLKPESQSPQKDGSDASSESSINSQEQVIPDQSISPESIPDVEPNPNSISEPIQGERT